MWTDLSQSICLLIFQLKDIDLHKIIFFHPFHIAYFIIIIIIIFIIILTRSLFCP